MEQIVLDDIRVNENRIEYAWHVTDGLLKYFIPETPWFVEYWLNGQPLPVDSVPRGVLAMPFVSNVLPISWAADAELVVDELDREFFDSFAPVQQAYSKMYPDMRFGGGLPDRTADEGIARAS